jgi:hypothetical protein
MEMPGDNPMSDTEAVIARLSAIVDGRADDTPAVAAFSTGLGLSANVGDLRALLALAKRPGEVSAPILTAEEEDRLVEEINGRVNLQPVTRTDDVLVTRAKLAKKMARDLLARDLDPDSMDEALFTAWFSAAIEKGQALSGGREVERLREAWEEGWRLCKASLTDDEAFCLTDDVQADAWADSATRAALTVAGEAE